MDIHPYYLCCFNQPRELCALYYDKRRSNNGTLYRAKRNATIHGDPHISTFDGLTYTFNGAGEFWLLKNDSAQSLGVQARFEQRGRGTVMTALAMKDTHSSLIQVTYLYGN